MPSKSFFPSADEFPHDLSSPFDSIRKGWNCLLFALGISIPIPLYSGLSVLDYHVEIGISFLMKIDELHKEGLINFRSDCFRRIMSVEESPKSIYYFRVYGFTVYQVWNKHWECFFDMPGDFHVIRGHRQNGEIIWEHKFGWNERPRNLTPSDWEELEQDYGKNYVLFAFTPNTSD